MKFLTLYQKKGDIVNMPKLVQNKDNDMVVGIPGPGNFQFSAVRIEDLGASEYTLATIICDISGSVSGFADQLLECIKTIVESCKKSPRSENLLLRLLTFNENVFEIHGFKELHMIDINSYDALNPHGTTALYDATFDGVGATLEYGKKLGDEDYDCNAAVYIITDGLDNESSTVPSMTKDKIEACMQHEDIESIITILVELKNPNSSYASDVTKALAKFKDEAGINEHINIGDATKEKLAKLANFVSQSISSQSQALGTGGPSQILQF